MAESLLRTIRINDVMQLTHDNGKTWENAYVLVNDRDVELAKIRVKATQGMTRRFRVKRGRRIILGGGVVVRPIQHRFDHLSYAILNSRETSYNFATVS